MLVVDGVSIALFGTGDARCRAGLDRRANEAHVATGLPRRDARSRLADVSAGVSALETDADDLNQLRQIVLAQAGVCARCALGAAIETRLGTPKERIAVIAARQRPRLHDCAEGHLPERAGELAIPWDTHGAKESMPFPVFAWKGFRTLGAVLWGSWTAAVLPASRASATTRWSDERALPSGAHSRTRGDAE